VRQEGGAIASSNHQTTTTAVVRVAMRLRYGLFALAT